jgi:cytohesin
MRLAEQMQLQQQMTYALQLEAGAGAAQPQAASIDPLKLAVVKFNSKPKDGVRYMIKQKLCRKQAKDLARLLWQLPQLNMAQLGDYLSEKAEFNQSVLREFARQIDLKGLAFDAALRQFLQHFRLPGEAQKIDRIMECFAAHFLEQNAATCHLSPDTCFVLAFSTIMLNTDLHNPAIKNKMTRDEFIKNTRHISDELSTEFLTELYDNISRHEIKMDVDAFGDQEKSGFLAKRQLAGWKRKWFVLSNNNLYYFNDKDDKNPRFILPLEALQVRKASQLGQKYCCEIFDANARLLKCCKLSGDGVLIEAKQKTLILAADTEAERDDWLAAIGQNVLANPFYEFLKRRLETKGKPAAAPAPTTQEDAD